MKTRVVVIPIYQKEFNAFEEYSLKQTFRIFHKENLAIVTYSRLLPIVKRQLIFQSCPNLKIEIFDEFYFVHGTKGYNMLLLSPQFYTRFSSYEYMLICQTDAMPFRNELDDRCKQGFDIIGAPSVHHGSYLYNGGFSLRRIPSFLDFTSNTKLFCISFMKYNHRYIKDGIGAYIHLRSFFKALLIRYGVKILVKVKNEDIIFSRIPFFAKPSDEDAKRFAFEYNPEILYEDLSKQLPFGCHAWQLPCNYSFWKKVLSLGI